ncbi:MAG: SIS domain-containing protein [Chlamydiota bacterium]
MRDAILASAREGVQAIESLLQEEALMFIDQGSSMIAQCYQQGGKILIAGNGGSLCDAMHFAEELTGFYRNPRQALAAIALSDPGHMSCVGNDVGFSKVFSRSLEALARPEDIFIALTTSGNSQNIVEAMTTAKRLKIKTIAFLGKEGGLLKGVADLEWIVKGFKYSDRVQEAHMTAIHIMIEMVEKKLEQHHQRIQQQAVVSLRAFS